MKIEEKKKLFEKELAIIIDPEVKKFVEDLFNKLPDYFFTVAASSTGEYHPNYALGEGGLVRHTKAAIKIAHELFTLEMFRSLFEDKDVVLAALLFHDGFKHGLEKSQYTVQEHPRIMYDFIKKNYPKNKIADKIAGLILTHMGQWNKNYNYREIMPKPSTKLENFVHLCDYLASRKCLEMNFEI